MWNIIAQYVLDFEMAQIAFVITTNHQMHRLKNKKRPQILKDDYYFFNSFCSYFKQLYVSYQQALSIVPTKVISYHL